MRVSILAEAWWKTTMPRHTARARTHARSLACEVVVTKLPVSLLTHALLASTAMFALVLGCPTAVVAVGGSQVAAMAVYRLTQVFLQRRSHENVQTLAREIHSNSANCIITVGANGELCIIKVLSHHWTWPASRQRDAPHHPHLVLMDSHASTAK